ncbi:ABC transporter permease [Rhizobium sp. EC-SD404]|uniref:nickel/cobalt transporter n=1 Tax=Rhizobium sp. EC-SD404 TaxID=2038389 RepID=UPI00125C1E0B|nr:ABC transporter permease [Rhizobium sp. EC-SD404]VVS96722.1 Nickel/cobalt efflux system [Rhizobium sp. EC-SD404]
MPFLVQSLIDVQRDIYLTFADTIRAFASGGGWLDLATFLPMAIVFGAVHALTPGHSKTVLATYLAGSTISVARGLAVSLTLSFTLVLMAVIIALFSLPLISIALGSVGRAPAMENVSRGLLGLIGLWMLWRAVRGHRHGDGENKGLLVGIVAGLIPCPLTLFVMIFAMQRGITEAGLAFAAMMMLGVATTLSAVALATVFFRQAFAALIASRLLLLNQVSRVIEGLPGLILVLIAFRTIAEP